jgi:hypothetical protein
MTYTYLASPYSHPNPSIMRGRYQAALAATHYLLTQRIWTYSPIVHSHTLALQYDLPTSFEYWMDYCHAMLAPAHDFMILALDGWQESKGVTEETSLAYALNKPIRFIKPPHSIINPTYFISEDPIL